MYIYIYIYIYVYILPRSIRISAKSFVLIKLSSKHSRAQFYNSVYCYSTLN